MIEPPIEARFMKHVTTRQSPDLISFLQTTQTHHAVGGGAVVAGVAELVREDPIHVELVSQEDQVGQAGAEEESGVVEEVVCGRDAVEMEEVEEGEEDGAEMGDAAGDCGD
ncbi:hypothetical protein QQ045_019937 [Rhodiola kirilowii]